MKKLRIEPGCITCGLCEFIAPEIFSVTDVSRIKESAPLERYETEIENAVRGCPVAVIKYEKLKGK
jgi:ferredoxin